MKFFPASQARTGTNFTKPRIKTLADLCIINSQLLQTGGVPARPLSLHRDDAEGPPDPWQLSRGLVRGQLHLQPAHRRVLQHGVERALPSHAALPHAPPQTLRR